MDPSTDTPTQEDLKELLERAEEIKEKIEDYHEVAAEIDDNFINNHDEDAQEIHLDILPYGEELARTSGLPEELAQAIDKLDNLSEKDDLSSSKELIADITDSINDAEDTLEDCTPLPEADDED